MIGLSSLPLTFGTSEISTDYVPIITQFTVQLLDHRRNYVLG